MENVIVFIICAALIIFGGMTMSQNFLSSVDNNSTSFARMEERDISIFRSALSAVRVTEPTAADIEVTIRNTGQTKFRNFDKWDMIVQYTDEDNAYHVKWLPKVAGTPGDDQWSVKGIYMNAQLGTPEVFDPGILNAGEEIVVQAKLNPSVKTGATNMVAVSAENGTETSIIFSS